MAVKIVNRSMNIPIPERTIGYIGDNCVETRAFKLARMYGDVDLSTFDFKLDTEINGTKNIIDLDKSVTEDKITLTWTVRESHILRPGRMSIQIRAFSQGEEKWHSALNYVFVQPSINATKVQPDPLPSEFIQMEQRVTAMKNQAQEAAQTATEQANRAQGIADEFENETLPAAIAAVEAAVDKQVDIAASHADRAQGIADIFDEVTLPAAITAVEDAGQAKVDLAEQQADRAQGIADTFENTTLPAAIQSVEQAVEEQIGIAKGHADRAQGIADEFENETLPAAIAAGQAKVDEAKAEADRAEEAKVDLAIAAANIAASMVVEEGQNWEKEVFLTVAVADIVRAMSVEEGQNWEGVSI